MEDEAAKKIESDPSARKEAEKSLPELAKKLNLSIEDLADSKKVEMALMTNLIPCLDIHQQGIFVLIKLSYL